MKLLFSVVLAGGWMHNAPPTSLPETQIVPQIRSISVVSQPIAPLAMRAIRASA
jgi:hypothetical protein